MPLSGKGYWLDEWKNGIWPRLGARSIIADPRSPKMQKQLN